MQIVSHHTPGVKAVRAACLALALGLLAGPVAALAEEGPYVQHRPQLRALMHKLHKMHHWRMLEVTRYRSAHGQPRLRLKLLGPRGRVRVLEVDPVRPDLQRLQ